jgi:hypothetical protein
MSLVKEILSYKLVSCPVLFHRKNDVLLEFDLENLPGKM